MIRLCILVLLLSVSTFGQNIVSGRAYNSFDHSSYEGATITMQEDSGAIYTATSQSTGKFSISVPTGIYNFNITAPGKWYSNIYPLTVTGDISSYDFALVDMLTGMDFEFLVFWGSQPRDLDAYLFTPFYCNASWEAPSSCGRGSTVARWAFDVKSGWGPESIELKNASPGRYEFWVNLVQSGSDSFSAGDGNRVPTAFFNFPTNNTTPQQVPVTPTKDITKVWWRAIQLIVPSTGPYTWSFPNELYTSPPTPWGLGDLSTSSTTSSSEVTSTSTSSSTSNSSTTIDQSTVSSANPNPSSTGNGNAGGNGWLAPFSNINSTINNQPGCTDAEIKSCQGTMATCAGNTSMAMCDCFMKLGDCLTLYGCMPGTKISFEKECSNAGCEQSKCESFASSGNKLLHSWVAIFLIFVSAFGMTKT